MNWLAHLYLADDSDESMLGNLFGDFLRGVEWKKVYPREIRRGIRTHFSVDRFTDTHEIFQRSCSRVSERNSCYSTVLIDLFYDHYLGRLWSDYSSTPLEEFIQHFYDVLERNRSILPPKLLGICDYMIGNNWLLSYREIEGIGSVVQRLSRYAMKDAPIINGVKELTDNYDEMQEDFRQFFPLVIKHVKELHFDDL